MASNSDLRLTIARLARRMRHERGTSDFTDGQTAVLFALAAHGPQTLSELSTNEGITAPSMNRTVNSLEAVDLLVRSASPDDGRKIIIKLTDSGCAVVDEHRRLRDARFAERLSTLTDDERLSLEAAAPVLRKLAEQ